MRHFFRISLFLLLAVAGNAQNVFSQETKFSVKEFYLDEFDMTASYPPDSRIDQNGSICARIKIETNLELAIEGGVGGIVDTKKVGGEFWVYIPYKTRSLKSISHADIEGVIRDYQFDDIRLEAGRTYIMKLNFPDSKTRGREWDLSKKQSVKVKVIPQNASLEINGFAHVLDSLGYLQVDMPYGVHDFSVSADNYHSVLKRVTIDDNSEGVEQVIHLKQAFGWLKTNFAGDEKLFLDDKEYKLSSSNKGVFAIKSGNYRVRVEKPLHKTYNTTVQIKDSVVVELASALVANYKEMSFSVDKSGAEIWIDGKYHGKGKWAGKLEYGDHTVETKLARHKTMKKVYRIQPDSVPTVKLDSPEPIYGKLVVLTEPAGADVYIDNVKSGKTPFSKSIQIGDYSVAIKKDGFRSETEHVSIKENEQKVLNKKMNDVFPVSISVKPSYSAKVRIDNNLMTDYTNVSLVAGEHDIEVSAPGYKTLAKKFMVETPYQSYEYQLKRILYEKSQFYFGGAVSSLNGSLMYGGYLGFYSKGFNMEFFYMMGNDKSDKIYWNTLHYMQRPSMHVYAPTEMGARLGWGILLGRGARLTPQVGAGYMKLDTVENERGYYDAGKTCDALSFKAGMKLSIALGGCMELNVMPEFSSMIMKSNVYESLCNASSVIEGWGNGFAINAGIGFYF